MAGRYAIETAFNFIDRITNPMKKIDSQSKVVNRSLKNMYYDAEKATAKFGNSLKKVGGKMAKAFGLAGILNIDKVVGFVTKDIKNAIEYQSALAKVGTIADATAVPLDELSKHIIDVSSKTGVASNKIAESMYSAIAAGVPTAKAAAFVETATKAAIGGFSDEATVIDGLTSVLNSYGLQAEHAAKISDQMLLAQNMGKTSFNDMANSIGKVIPYASHLNMSTEELFASISTLTGSGALKTSDAMSSIKSALTSVINPSKEAAETARRLGVDFSASALQAKGFKKFIDEISQAAGGNQSIIGKLFGSDKADTAIRILTSTGAQAFSETYEAMKNAAGATDTAFEKMMDTPEKRWGKVMNTMRNAGINFGNAILPMIERVTGKIGGIADGIAKVDFSQYAASFEKVFRGVENFISALIGAVKIAWTFRGVIFAVVGVLGAYYGISMLIIGVSKLMALWEGIKQVAIFAATLAFKGQEVAVGTLTKQTMAYNAIQKALAIKAGITAVATGIATAAQTAYSVAAGVATAAQTALNVALTANPIGVIIMAVAALIVLIIIVIKNINKITAWIKSNTNKVMLFFTVLYGPIGIVISMIKELVSNWGRIKDALAATGLFEKIKEIGDAIKNFIKPALDWLLNVWQTIKNAVTGFFSYVVNAVKSFFAPAVSAIGSFFKNIFNAVYNFVKPALDFISEKWQQIVGFFKDNAIINAIKVIGGTLLSGILAPIQGLLEMLSRIPKLGHLAGDGAKKIEEFRNFLKGVDGATVTAEVNPPENVTLTPPTDSGMETVSIPDFDMANFALGGADTAGRSKLHGVVDISDGAVASAFGGNSTYTATAATGGAAAATNAAPAVLQAILNNIIIVSATLKNIETATQTAFALPRVNMSGGNEDTPNNYNPRYIAPVTQAERTAYNVQERIDRLIIQVAAENGTSARIVQAPRNAEIQLVKSGGNA